MSEDKELLTRISQVAGHINRHRNQQKSGTEDYAASGLSTPPLHNTDYSGTDALHWPFLAVEADLFQGQSWGGISWRPSRGRPYGRVRARGGRPLLQGHRNRSLVLNNMTNTVPASDSPPPASAVSEETSPDAAGSSTSWVAKRDRHIQLINSSVFDKETQARARAMEETRKQKTRHKEERQRLKFMRYLQNVSLKSSQPSVRSAGDSNSHHEVTIGGVRYQVLMGGSKLQKASDDVNSVKATPKKAAIGGVTFLRSKNGNLWQSGIVRAKLVPMFTMRVKLPFARSFYRRDPAALVMPAIFLTSLLLIEYRPVSIFFEGCARTPSADYGNTGACNNKHCKLPHVDRAGQIRKTTASNAGGLVLEGAPDGKEAVTTAATTTEESDISSEEGDYDEIDSDGVDSDGLDEELTAPANLQEENREISRQQDFIPL
ncbi:MAG: hypothetical protein M1840_003880 [Geoglossum simile]|nr:MAG: hypothetical protein M1840_003880 [Geoglossum simile]